MRLHEAIEIYLADLRAAGYSQTDIRRKAVILRHHMAYALALHDPRIPPKLAELSEIRPDDRAMIGADLARHRQESADHFLAIFRRESRQGISHLALATFMQQYQAEHLSGRADSPIREQAISDLACTLGLETELPAMDRRTHEQVMEYLGRVGAARVASYTAAFFGYCHRKGWLSFEPPTRVRRPYQRLFDADFLAGNGTWIARLRLYLEYLRDEKHLSNGGIDYYARKLRIFVRWLDERSTAERVNTQTLKEFLSEREKQGVKALTRGKYLYSVRYFFDFMLSKGLQKANPAIDLRIKADPSPEGETLSELEVVRVIEQLESREFESRGAQEVPQQIHHFRALRDLCLFLIFTLTGVRLSEACGMRLEDLDFTKRSVCIKAKGNRTYRKKHRQILLPDALWRSLTQYLRARSHPGAGWLWISWLGQPMTASGVNKVIARRVQEDGVSKHISPHRLRATCASLYVKRGMDPFSLKTLLGHESVSTTMDHYARLTEEELRAVWKRANPLAGTDDE